MPPLSRPWTGAVAGLVVLAAGCAQQPRDPDARLVARADRAVAELHRLQPRLAKAGTPGADELAANLAAVREDLSQLPRDPAAPAATAAGATAGGTIALPPAASARARPAPLPPLPDAWRLGVQAEVAAWRVRLRGGGAQLDDVGPAATGLALAIERERAVDERLAWSLGVEFAAMRQPRRDGQHLDLYGVRPVLRGALALGDGVALTARPILEFGQASVRLGAPPDGVLDRADVYVGFGARVGLRVATGRGDFTAEAGWRRCMFQGSAGTLDYRVDVWGPEAAAGWSWSY